MNIETNKNKNWTKKEDELLIRNYSKYTIEELAEKLNRSYSGVDYRLRILKIRNKINKWTDEEIKLVKDKYSILGSKRLEHILKKTANAIKAKAFNLGIIIDYDKYQPHCLNTENLSHFFSIDSPFIAYLLGFLWADGHLVKRKKGRYGYRLMFCISHADFLQIKKLLLSTAKSWTYRIENRALRKDGTKSIMAIASINHKALWKFLVENDYLIKSGASADKILSKIPEHLKHYWWRGFFDGDGNFFLNLKRGCGRITLASCYKQDWNFVVQLLKKLEIYRYKIRQVITKTGKGSTIMFENERDVITFCKYIYQGKQFGLKRKLRKFISYVRYKRKMKRTILYNKSSQYRGVCKFRKGWVSSICYEGKHHQKYFDKEIDAAREYDRLAIYYLGSRAILNFSNE